MADGIHVALVVLPVWNEEMHAKLARARIRPWRDGHEPFRDGPTELSLELAASSERDARVRIAKALFPKVGPQDFGRVAALPQREAA